MRAPDVESKIQTFPSPKDPDPATIFAPSGDQITLLTCESQLNCHNCLPVFTSHTRTLLSFPKLEPLPEAIVRPSGEKSTQLTLAECPLCGDFTTLVKPFFLA